MAGTPEKSESAREDWKNFRGNLDQIVASWCNNQTLRLMFQNEAHFRRITASPVTVGAIPTASSMPW